MAAKERADLSLKSLQMVFVNTIFFDLLTKAHPVIFFWGRRFDFFGSNVINSSLAMTTLMVIRI